jgi:Rad52/22 family double-strand break repair protein
MAFTETQVRALRRRVPAQRVKTRMSDGKELSYIEGWFALEQANRIFGFDGWDRQTLETQRLHRHADRASATAVYSARVRVTVRSDSATIIRDGHGTGEASARTLAEAHDRALKAAETDATKRALATFGKAFGLALHAGKSHVAPISTGQPTTPDRTGAPPSRTSPPAAVNGKSASIQRREIELANAEPIKVSGRRWRRLQLPAIPIDKSLLTISEPRRVRSKEHLRFVASQPCLVCGANPCDPHHLRYAQPRAMSRKVSDEFTVPLCRNHHRELHQEGNEAVWWHDMGIEPLEVAQELWAESRKQAGEAFGSGCVQVG